MNKSKAKISKADVSAITKSISVIKKLKDRYTFSEDAIEDDWYYDLKSAYETLQTVLDMNKMIKEQESKHD